MWCLFMKVYVNRGWTACNNYNYYMQFFIVSSVNVVGDGLVGKQQVTVITSNMFQLKIHILVLFQKCFTPKNCFSVSYKWELTCFWSVLFLYSLCTLV